MITKDQERLKLHSKVKKHARSYPLKAAAWVTETVAFCALPLALFIHPTVLIITPIALVVRWRLLIMAAKVYGPHLGDDPGRARKATYDDARKARLT